jgi:hypothetical protein
VLLVDNLDLVLDRLSDSLWDLREALSIDNGLVVVGASFKFIEEAIDYQSPLYDFFHVHELGPLSEDEARRLVLSLARRANTPQVAEVLELDPGRFKALYVLTGGVPRTLALLHTVLALEHHDRIERDLDDLLDQLTPYYKARFDDLPSQSQVIVDNVALHWHPITAAECQTATHLDINIVSAQLSRLVKNGLLTKVSLPGPKKLGFQLSERFFNIWYLMRASRRLRRRLSWFVEFLRIFYGEEELRRRAEELVRAAPPESLNSPAKFLAFASAVPDESLRRRLEFRAIGLLVETGATAIHEIMDLEGEDVHLAPVIDRVQALRDIRARIAAAKVQWPRGLTSSSVAETIARSPFLTIAMKQEASHLIKKASDVHVETLCKLVVALPEDLFGAEERLLTAISSGEAPSPGDMSSAGEMEQIVGLTKSRALAVSLIVVLTEKHNNPLSDHLFRRLIDIDVSIIPALLFASLASPIFTKPHHWKRTRHLILFIVRHAANSLSIEPFIIFFRRCIRAGLTREALELFIETGLHERWAAFYEAFCAAAEDGTARLERLAPELWVTARALYEQLRAPDDLSLAGDAHEISAASIPRQKRTSARKRVGLQDKPPRRTKQLERSRSGPKRV